ncbi:MAG: SDR family oxidoreductase [Sphingomonadales bacterium]|nr:SDR family oxidoreductase [Sphingomonadales bacterium]
MVARIALVTGGASGMGEAASLRLAQEGRPVAILDVDGPGAERVARQIVDAGGKALALQADISRKDQVDAAVAQVRQKLGPVTILVNNAATENFCPFADISEANWDRIMAVNLKGVFLPAQAVLPDMVAAGWGRIVNISAYGAQIGAAEMAHYTASKGGVISLTRSLAIELGGKGITVNSVSPGFIDTPMARRVIEGGKFSIPAEQLVAGYPIPRLGRPEEIAAACCFLASEDAGYITGQVLGVNGGAAM